MANNCFNIWIWVDPFCNDIELVTKKENQIISFFRDSQHLLPVLRAGYPEFQISEKYYSVGRDGAFVSIFFESPNGDNPEGIRLLSEHELLKGYRVEYRIEIEGEEDIDYWAQDGEIDYLEIRE